MKRTSFLDRGLIEQPMPPTERSWQGYRRGQDAWLDELWHKVRTVVTPGYVATMDCRALDPGTSLLSTDWNTPSADELRPVTRYMWTDCNPWGACKTTWALPTDGEPTDGVTLKDGHIYRYDSRSLYKSEPATVGCVRVVVVWHPAGSPAHQASTKVET